MNLLKETGLRTFTTGIKGSELNTMNQKINELVRTVNVLMKEVINVNLEFDDTEYTLEEALALVPEERRVPGICVIYKAKDEQWHKVTFLGGTWTDSGSWATGGNDIDGGEW